MRFALGGKVERQVFVRGGRLLARLGGAGAAEQREPGRLIVAEGESREHVRLAHRRQGEPVESGGADGAGAAAPARGRAGERRQVEAEVKVRPAVDRDLE